MDARCRCRKASAIAAARAVDAGYAGVDIIADASGRLQVLEVNSMPAWKSLQQVSRIDIAEVLATDLLSRVVQAPEQRRAAPMRNVAGQ